jgi:transposase
VQARVAFAEAQPSLEAASLVFVDEAGVNRAMTRRYGRSKRGTRAVGYAPSAYGKNTTMIGAMSAHGLIALEKVVGGGTTHDVFFAFVREVLTPVLRPGQTVVLDNLSAHKQTRVREAIEAVGCRLLHIPSYSPDFNAIEQAWSKMKAELRRVAARTQEALEAAIDAARAVVTAADAQGWIRGAGYTLQING